MTETTKPSQGSDSVRERGVLNRILKKKDFTLGPPLGGSGHTVRKGTIIIDDIINRFFYKENKVEGKPIMSVLEVGLSTVWSQLLGQNTCDTALVEDEQSQIDAVAAKELPEFKEFIKYNLEEQMELFNPDTTDGEANIRQLAKTLVFCYCLEEDDLHKNNIGTALIDGKQQIAKIDHDMSLYRGVSSFEGRRIWGHMSDDRFPVFAEDIKQFPDLIFANPHFFPHKSRATTGGKSWTDDETLFYRSLGHRLKKPDPNPYDAGDRRRQIFEEAKFEAFIEFLYMDREKLRQSLAKQIPNDLEVQNRILDAVLMRQDLIRTELVTMPKFSEHLDKANAQDKLAGLTKEEQEIRVHRNIELQMQVNQASNYKPHSETTLHKAIRLNVYRPNLTLLRYKKDINKKSGKPRKTPLQLAITVGNLEAVKELLAVQFSDLSRSQAKPLLRLANEHKQYDAYFMIAKAANCSIKPKKLLADIKEEQGNIFKSPYYLAHYLTQATKVEHKRLQSQFTEVYWKHAGDMTDPKRLATTWLLDQRNIKASLEQARFEQFDVVNQFTKAAEYYISALEHTHKPEEITKKKGFLYRSLAPKNAELKEALKHSTYFTECFSDDPAQQLRNQIKAILENTDATLSEKKAQALSAFKSTLNKIDKDDLSALIKIKNILKSPEAKFIRSLRSDKWATRMVRHSTGTSTSYISIANMLNKKAGYTLVEYTGRRLHIGSYDKKWVQRHTPLPRYSPTNGSSYSRERETIASQKTSLDSLNKDYSYKALEIARKKKLDLAQLKTIKSALHEYYKWRLKFSKTAFSSFKVFSHSQKGLNRVRKLMDEVDRFIDNYDKKSPDEIIQFLTRLNKKLKKSGSSEHSLARIVHDKTLYGNAFSQTVFEEMKRNKTLLRAYSAPAAAA